jgi:uncharacterized membrane protein
LNKFRFEEIRDGVIAIIKIMGLDFKAPYGELLGNLLSLWRVTLTRELGFENVEFIGLTTNTCCVPLSV